MRKLAIITVVLIILTLTLLPEKTLSISPRGTFDEPRGIVSSPAGTVYVADTRNDRVQVFDSQGKFIRYFGSSGSGEGQFSKPEGIAVNSRGEIFVADTGNHRIQVFDSTGKFLREWGRKGSGTPSPEPTTPKKKTDKDKDKDKEKEKEKNEPQFINPNCLAIDRSGNVYVGDFGNNRIQKFDAKGTFIFTWGKEGTGDGEFRDIGGIAIDGGGAIYVTDVMNKCIQKFQMWQDPKDRSIVEAKLLKKWTYSGSRSGNLNGPAGIAVTRGGLVYVIDMIDCMVTAYYGSNGKLRGISWGSYGSKPSQFTSPRGIAVDSHGNVYVLDTGNSRVQKFTETGRFLKTWGAQ